MKTNSNQECFVPADDSSMKDKRTLKRGVLEKVEALGITAFKYGMFAGLAVLLIGGAIVVFEEPAYRQARMYVVIGIMMIICACAACMFGLSFLARACIAAIRLRKRDVSRRMAISEIAAHAFAALLSGGVGIAALRQGARLVASLD